nr:RNA-binding transcriptional accessory protein [Herpetosiphonaceae bacterium]
MNYEHQIASQLKVRPEQVAATIALFDAGNTLPFVARYRKEQTDGLDEDQLRRIQTTLARLRELEDRRQTIIAAITEQGKLTDELHVALLDASDKTTLEDLYAPYKQKRRTRASIARERGLLPLAEVILAQAGGREPIEAVAARFLGDEVSSIEDALAGARDIVAETISEHAEVRRATRERALRWGVVGSQKIADAPDLKGVFQTYYEFEAVASRLKPYQVLALNRGESEGVLRVRLAVAERDWRDAVLAAFRPDQRSPWADQLTLAIADSAERLLLPAIERDVRRTLTEAAEAHAITVFAKNVQALLLQPPIAGNVVLGIDPGFRTGCKIAVVAPTGTVLETTTIYPHTGGGGRDTALQTLSRLAEKHRVTLVAIGNGTASRETEQLTADLIRRVPALRYLIVSEAGA